MLLRLSVLAALVEPLLTVRVSQQTGLESPLDLTRVYHLYAGALTRTRLSEQQVRVFDGEFHTGLVSSTPVVDLLRKPQCKHFYNRPAMQSNIMVEDTQTDLLRPSDEVPNATGYPMTAPSFQRMVTYEDIAVPIDWHENFTGLQRAFFSPTCLQMAVRTAQRPVKVSMWLSDQDRKLVMASVWKCGTTTLKELFKNISNKRFFIPQHTQHPFFCEGHPDSFPFRTCGWHTSFAPDAADADVYAASARNPLERFMAGIHEHDQWPSCDGEPCPEAVEQAKSVAKQLLLNFPHRYRSCPLPTQSYFLSATDKQGQPVDWSLVMRLEEFASELATLRNLTGLDIPNLIVQMSSGSRSMKQKYFDAIYSDLATVCAVCKVYAQDFACLGYERPGNCTQTKCLTVGIHLDD
jgi:hypothetical protein